MKRERFLVALLSAGLTFSALAFTVGTDHWKYRGWHGHHHGCYHHEHGDWHKEKQEPKNPADETNSL